MTLTLARGGAKSDRHTTRHADQVEPPQAVMVGPTQAVRTTLTFTHAGQVDLIYLDPPYTEFI